MSNIPPTDKRKSAPWLVKFGKHQLSLAGTLGGLLSDSHLYLRGYYQPGLAGTQRATFVHVLVNGWLGWYVFGGAWRVAIQVWWWVPSVFDGCLVVRSPFREEHLVVVPNFFWYIYTNLGQTSRFVPCHTPPL